MSIRNHNVAVVTLRNEESNSDSQNIPVHRLPAIHFPVKNYFKHLRISSIYPHNYFTICQIARNLKTDVILLVNHYLDVAFPAIVAAKTAGIPLICSVGTQLQSSNPRRDKILNIVDRLICGHLIFPSCQRIIAWDTQILQYLEDVHGKKITEKTDIINYGVNGDIDVFMKHQHDYELCNQILGVGAVIEQRSFVPLIKAFSLVAEQFPKVSLKIVGHVYHDEAVKLCHHLKLSHRVTFTGELPHNTVMKEFEKSDIYYVSLTGKYVGLGTATIESMLMGIPAVANVPADLLGKAILRDGEDIMLADGNSPETIAEKIRLLLRNKTLREKIGQNGRHFIHGNLNWSIVARDMENVFNSVIEEHRNGRA
ncbi:MAG: glycosyltransferase family 4 protein [Nitrospirae bacterium]|nr:glycosyltransferase family 4 protein [Nitrospirota bacterium]